MCKHLAVFIVIWSAIGSMISAVSRADQQPPKPSPKRVNSIHGSVLDPDGKPLVGVEIKGWVTWDEPDRVVARITARSQKGGKFRIDLPRPPAAPLEIRFFHRGRRLGLYIARPTPKKNKREIQLDVRLEPVSSLKGRVVDDDTSKPIPGAEISLSRYEVEPDQAASTITNKQGVFEFDGLLTKVRYLVRVDKAAGYATRFATQQVRAADSKPQQLGAIRLVPLATPKGQQVEPPSIENLTPENAYRILRDQHQKDMRAFRRELRAAKTPAALEKVVRRREPTARYVRAFQQLANDNPQATVAVKSLVWIMTVGVTSGTEAAKMLPPLRKEIGRRLLSDYVDRKELAECILALIYSQKGKELNAALELVARSQKRQVRGLAMYAAAELLLRKRRQLLASGKSPPLSELRQARQLLTTVREKFADLRFAPASGFPSRADITLGEAAQKELAKLAKP